MATIENADQILSVTATVKALIVEANAADDQVRAAEVALLQLRRQQHEKRSALLAARLQLSAALVARV
jgi:hypothetical protein